MAVLLALRILRGYFFLAGFFRVSLEGLSKRETTRSPKKELFENDVATILM